MATASIRINGGTAGLAETDLPLNTLVALSNADDSGVSTHEWVIVSQPAGGQDDLDPPYPSNPIVSTYPAPTFTPTKEGSYLIKLTVNKGLADEATDTTICAVRELLTGDRIPAPQETTEVSEEYGWATAAVTKILQRVTRMSDAGIFVAQNASGGNLELGKVVHLNGMSTIGTGDNERPIPTVDLALADDPAKVDGPLGVVVGDRDGGTVPVGWGELCRVMVMGGIPAYNLGGSAIAGDPVFVNDTGNLSLTAGTVVRQVGDVAKALGGTIYDIAISAGANSIPRGNALGDLSGQYPDPTVAKINNTTITTAGGSLATGSVLRVTGASAADWGPVDLADTDAVTNALPMDKGGTGQALYQSLGGIVYSTTDSKLEIAAPGTAGYLLTSGGAGAPSWAQYVPLANGGTNTTLAAAATNSVIYKAATALAATSAPSAVGQVLRHTATGPAFGAVDLADTDAVTGTLAVNRGGTGQSTALTTGRLLYSASATEVGQVAAAVTINSVLTSGASPTSTPVWQPYVLVTQGGTGRQSLTDNGILYGNGTSALNVTAAGSSGAILTGSIAGVPIWKAAGSAGQILTLVNLAPGIDTLDWQDFADYFNDQYVSNVTATTGLWTTTSTTYSAIVVVGPTPLKVGIAVAAPGPIDGATFSNSITTVGNGAVTEVSLQYVVTGPGAFGTQNFVYRFSTPASHGPNQPNGSICFPTLTFFASVAGNYTVTLNGRVGTSGDTFTVTNIVLRLAQG